MKPPSGSNKTNPDKANFKRGTDALNSVQCAIAEEHLVLNPIQL